jgi:hypothetical protein
VTQQQQDKTTAEWNSWFTASFDAHMAQHTAAIEKALEENFHTVGESFDNVGKDLVDAFDEIDTLAGQHDKKIFELLEIVQVLAVDNDFLRGRIDQITREFKGLTRKQASKTIERTIATTEEQSSRVSKTLSIIDEVLHG